MSLGRSRSGVPAPYALPFGFAGFLAVGTVTAALGGRLTGTGVLIACAAVAGVMSAVAEPAASVPLAGIGWLTVTGFSAPPYAQLRTSGAASAAGGGGHRGDGVVLRRSRAWCSAGTGGVAHW